MGKKSKSQREAIIKYFLKYLAFGEYSLRNLFLDSGGGKNIWLFTSASAASHLCIKKHRLCKFCTTAASVT